MKILPVIRNIQTDIKNTSIRVSRAGNSGYNIGLRTSKINNNNRFKTSLNICRSVSRKIAKETTINDLPIIAGAIGLLVPLPLASPIMLCAGKIIQLAAKAVKKSN